MHPQQPSFGPIRSPRGLVDVSVSDHELVLRHRDSCATGSTPTGPGSRRLTLRLATTRGEMTLRSRDRTQLEGLAWALQRR